MKTRITNHPKTSAFSLLELLVVITIIGIIGAFAVPAVGNLLKGSAMAQAANLISDQTASARQYALTRNRTVEVRFYTFVDPEQPGDTTQYRALQFLEIGDSGIANPVGKFTSLPNTVVMNPNAALSSVLNVSAATTPGANDPDLPRGVNRNYKYVSFRFLPDGSTNLSATGGTANGKWFVTAHLLSDLPRAAGSTPPPNFFTWMIDPVSGAMKILRPGV